MQAQIKRRGNQRHTYNGRKQRFDSSMAEWMLRVGRSSAAPDTEQHHHIGEQVGNRMNPIGDEGTALSENTRE